MGRASTRKAATQRPIDQVINEMAALHRIAGQRLTVRDADAMPATKAVVDSAMRHIGRNLPSRFMHKGDQYWLRITLGLVRLEIFPIKDAPRPLIDVVQSEVHGHGHQPPQ